jgi:hypothetical protein
MSPPGYAHNLVPLATGVQHIAHHRRAACLFPAYYRRAVAFQHRAGSSLQCVRRFQRADHHAQLYQLAACLAHQLAILASHRQQIGIPLRKKLE